MKKHFLPLNLQLFADDAAVDTGVDSASVAGEQTQDTFTTESTYTETDTGVEHTEVAAQVKDEKDFSTALKAREAQMRQQIEKEYGERYSGFDAAQERAKQLERAAKLNGWGDDVEGFVAKLDEVERDRQIQEEASRLGVDESVIRDHLSPLKQQLTQYEQQLKTLQQQEAVRQVEADVNALKTKYPDFGQYEKQVFDMMIKGEVNSLETAYRLASYDDKLNAIAKQKEQEVLANVTRRGEKQVLSSNDGASDTQFSIASASFEDIRKISERVQRGERITL